MSVILIATQVTAERSKGYIEGIAGGSSAAGRLGVKVWVNVHGGDTLRQVLAIVCRPD